MRDDSDKRPLALLVTRNFPPLLGGMEKVNQHLLAALQPAWRTALCGPAGCGNHVAPQTEVRQSIVKPLPAFLIATSWRAVALAWRCKPEWIVAGSGLTAPIAWLAARFAKGRMAVYLHGLDIVAPSRVYQWLWLPFIRRCGIALVNSSNTAQLAQSRGMRADKLHVLHPGTELPMMDAEAACKFREQHGLGQRPLLLSVGRLTQRKGLAEFVSKALPAIVSHYPDVLLIVIGGEASDALHAKAGSERQRILVMARIAEVEQSVRFLGRCDEATLGAAYQAADVHVFPVLELPGDVEGFGMVALEAAAHGLPTVAFAVGGVPDAVQAGHTGTLVEPGNYADLGAAVVRQLARAHDGAAVSACREFAAGKTWAIFEERLRSLLETSHGEGSSNNQMGVGDDLTDAASARKPHAVLDLPSRRLKGLKIERLLNLASRPQPIRMLEVGTGSGGIAHYFGTHPTLRCEVDAVDVHDNRLVTEGYRYRQVKDTQLPFEDACFDVVLSNHVIEHVGNEQAQRAHLAELHRVLRPDGVGYLAVPNRWMLIEPHYRLAFLSWLPRAWRTPYLRTMGKGDVYDCEPLQMLQLEYLLNHAGFGYLNLCVSALRLTFEIERAGTIGARVLRKTPDGMLKPLERIIPTMIYRVCRKVAL